jgi:hypothetical protein
LFLLASGVAFWFDDPSSTALPTMPIWVVVFYLVQDFIPAFNSPKVGLHLTWVCHIILRNDIIAKKYSDNASQ